MRIEGGFVLVDVGQLMSVWKACRVGPLGMGDFRAWLACREMIARRCMLEDGREATYGSGELARLLGVSHRRARASTRRLVAAGLLVWSAEAIVFPDQRLEDPGLADTIGGGRGSIAIPRRMLRRLAKGATPATIATALGVLLRCLSRRRGSGFEGRGRIKASWIARAFEVDLRRVKQARQNLVDSGWITPEVLSQSAENRWGRAYRIDLAWEGGRSLPPLLAAERREIATPSVNQEPLPEREIHQELAAGGRTGVEVRGTGETQTNPVPAGTKPVSSLPAPTFADVRPEDLRDVGRCLELHRQAVAKGLASGSEDGRLKFVALAEHARVVGKANPPGLFSALLRRGAWEFITQSEEDKARRTLKAHLFPPVPTLSPSLGGLSLKPTSWPTSRPELSHDARTVREIRRALAAKGFQGDPFPQVRRHDGSWSRERWDAALAELRK
jgi:hypothetical protein